MSTRAMRKQASEQRYNAVLTAIELQRIVLLSEAARLSGLSAECLKKRYPDKIIELTVKPRRRYGMRVKDALMLG